MDNATMVRILHEMADECRDPNGRVALAKAIDIFECSQVIAWHDDKSVWLTHRAKSAGLHALIYAPLGAILPREPAKEVKLGGSLDNYLIAMKRIAGGNDERR